MVGFWSGATRSILPFRNIELRVGQTIVFCRLSIYRSVTGSKKHLKPLKTRELEKAKIERRLAASWRLRFSWNFAGGRPWVTDHERRCRGRDASCLAPPARIRTSAIDAYGSYLGWVTAKRCS